MVRKQIQLTDKQAEAIKKMSSQMNLSIAEIIRRGIDSYIRAYGAISQEERRQRAIKSAGQFHSGKTDLSEKHDMYLVEIYRR